MAQHSENGPILNSEADLRRRYRRQLVVGLIVMALLAIPAVYHSQLAIKSMRNRPADWVPDSIPVKAAFNDFSKRFDVSDLLLIAWPGSDVGSDSILLAAETLSGISETPDAKRLPASDAFYAEVDDICENETPLVWVHSGSEMVGQMTSSPSNLSDKSAVARLSGTLIGPDKKLTCLVISMSDAGTAHRQVLLPLMRKEIARLAQLNPSDIAMVGGPLDGAIIDRESIRTIETFSSLSVLIAVVLCFLCLRSVPLTAVTIIVAVLGQGLVLAMVYFTGRDMNAVLIVLPPLVFVLTVSAGIHLSNYYLDIIHEFPDQDSATAAATAMKAGVTPCLLATATTVVGLLSLLLVRLEPVRIFGVIASIGITLTLLLLILVLPGAMLLTRRRKPSDVSRAKADDHHFNKLDHWVRRRLTRPWPIIIFFAAIAGFCATGLPHMHSSVAVSRMFLPESDLRLQYKWFEENVGPTATGDVVLRFPWNSETDSLDRLSDVVKVHKAILDIPEVGGVLSPATFVPSIPRSRRLSAVATRSVIRGLLEHADSSVGKLGYIARDDDHAYWRLTVRLPQNEDANFGPRIALIDNAVRDAVAKFDVIPDVEITGHIVIVEASQNILLGDLFTSFLSAFGVILLVMIFMLRSIVGGFLAMLPNLFPTITLFGTMGLMGLPLDIGAVMSASVALGIAVDDTIHLLSRYGSWRARGIGQIQSAHGALKQCGGAMFQTTLVCGISLMAFYFSDFVPTSNFSLFMFGLLASALLGVLLLLPSMMASRMGRYLAHSVSAAPTAKVNDGHTPPTDQ